MGLNGLKQVMEKLVARGEASGVVAVLVDDRKIIFNETVGMSALESPMKIDNKFRIASISKLITTIGFMKLVEEEKIRIEDDVSKYLDFDLRNPKYPNIKITPKMLLSHTSSVRDATYYTIPMAYTMKDFFCKKGKYYEEGNHFGKQGEKPGEYFTYSNLNFGIIAAIIEVITKKRFDIYMKEEVFEKLGIQASYNIRDFEEDINKVGTLFRKEKGIWVPQIDDYSGKVPKEGWYTYAIGDNHLEVERGEESLGIEKYILGSNGTLFSPHGGLRISGEDLAKIMRILINRGTLDKKSLLKSETIELMESSCWDYRGDNGDNMQGFINNYGLSIHKLNGKKFKGGDLKYFDGYRGHTGQAYGMLSAMFYNPINKKGFVYYITGSGKSLEKVLGKKSSFTSWEEEILESIKKIFNNKI